jgi:hypothetical protein
MAKQREPKRTQISVGVDDDLREQLEAAAKRELRSLSGEIHYRLQRSLEAEEAA